MKLGGSMKRRRKGASGTSEKKPRVRVPVDRTAAFATARTLGVVAVVGLLLGYLFATRITFPAPATPGNLVAVPELFEMMLEEAGIVLTDNELVVEVVDSISHPVMPAGAVLGQIPVPGQLTMAGSGVRLTVSRGQEMGMVPELERLSYERAMSVLDVAGFIAMVDSADSQLARGTVVSVDPAPGTSVALPGQVVLHVSRGPSEIEMPLVLGLPQEEAEELLESLGFELGEVLTRFRFGMDQGKVVEQRPPAGTMLDVGAAVQIVVGLRGRGRGGGG